MAVTRRSTFNALCSLLVITSIAAAEDAHAFQVQVSGTGRPILLIPGLASSGDTWKTTVAHLHRFRCHVLTLAGFAGTPPVEGPVFATVRRQLADYIRQQRLDHPIVIGHSLGGMIALGLAADHPDLVGPLVIVDALPWDDPAWFFREIDAFLVDPVSATRNRGFDTR